MLQRSLGPHQALTGNRTSRIIAVQLLAVIRCYRRSEDFSQIPVEFGSGFHILELIAFGNDPVSGKCAITDIPARFAYIKAHCSASSLSRGRPRR